MPDFTLSAPLRLGLAQLADAYTPILLIITLILCVRVGRAWMPWVRLGLSAAIVYTLMFADKYFHLWESVGLDYSTHTAAALALVVLLGSCISTMHLRLINGAALLAYAELMNMLGYHSWADILSTAVVIGLMLIPVYRLRFPWASFN